MPRIAPPMSAPTYARALALIEQLAFRLAISSVKSMPHPHEYTGARQGGHGAREGLCPAVPADQADGVFERWRGQLRRYLYHGDGNKYWAMTDVEPQSRVLNRMRVEDDA